MLTHQRSDLLLVFTVSFSCPNLTFCSISKAFAWSWLWKTTIYVWQFRSCVQFIFRWQAIIRDRLPNATFKSWNLKLSPPRKPSGILRNAMQKMLRMAVSIASCEQSRITRLGGPGQLLLEGPYDVIHDVIVCKSYVFADSQGSRLFFPLVENVLTQMHIQSAARREFMIWILECIFTKKKYFTG